LKILSKALQEFILTGQILRLIKLLLEFQYRNITELHQCVKRFSRDCLPRFAQQVTNLLLFGVSKANKPLCINDANKLAFTKISKCGNINIESKHSCMDQFIDNLKETESESGDKKIPLVCWYEKLRQLH